MNELEMSEWCMERTGRVRWPVFGPSHCGTFDHLDRGGINIEYWVRMECDPASLDASGFLIDNMAIEHLFEELVRTPTDLSCERLVMFCTERLVEYVNRTEPQCKITRIEMRLSPEPYSFKDSAVYVPRRAGRNPMRRYPGGPSRTPRITLEEGSEAMTMHGHSEKYTHEHLWTAARAAATSLSLGLDMGTEANEVKHQKLSELREMAGGYTSEGEFLFYPSSGKAVLIPAGSQCWADANAEWLDTDGRIYSAVPGSSSGEERPAFIRVIEVDQRPWERDSGDMVA